MTPRIYSVGHIHLAMTAKRGSSSVGALVMARAQKQLGDEHDDADLALTAIRLERRATEAIKLHLSELPELET
jgi:hypothetical protein